MFRRATALSPEFAPAHAGLAYLAYLQTLLGNVHDPGATLQQGLRDAERALALDDKDPYVHLALGRVCQLLGDKDRAIPTLEKAIDLNPSFAVAYNALGQALIWFGHAKEAIPLFTRAVRLSPRDSTLWSFYFNRSHSHLLIDEFDAAINDARAATRAKPDEYWPILILACAYNMAGRHDEARAAFDRACTLTPQLSETDLRAAMATFHPPYLERLMGELRKLGLPKI